MALITCPHCHTKIPDTAPECPVCRQLQNAPRGSSPYPFQTNKKQENYGLFALIFGSAALVFGCIGCGGVFALIGISLGIIELMQPVSNKPMAITAIILSGIGIISGFLLPFLITFFIFLVEALFVCI